MPQWDVTFQVNVAGVGGKVVTRVVDAVTLEDAIAVAKSDLVTIVTARVIPHAA